MEKVNVCYMFRKGLYSIALVLVFCEVLAQQKMRPIEALINRNDPGWALVQQWIAQAKNKV